MDDITKRLMTVPATGEASRTMEEASKEIERLRSALRIAADAIEIANDWNVPSVQVMPPPEWRLPGGGEDTSDGWCCTKALANKLREMVTSTAGIERR